MSDLRQQLHALAEKWKLRGRSLPSRDVLWCADELDALVRAAQPEKGAIDLTRLRELATFGARQNHEWYFDKTMNLDDHPPGGHVNDWSSGFGFSTCPHPDCALVRAASLPAPQPLDKKIPEGSCLVCGEHRPYAVFTNGMRDDVLSPRWVGVCQACRDAGQAAGGVRSAGPPQEK